MPATRIATRQSSEAYIVLNTTEVVNAVSANAVTIALNAGNHQVLNLSAATGDVAITITLPPSGISVGTLLVNPDDTNRGLTWAVTGGTVLWVGDAFATSQTGVQAQLISWRISGTTVYLAHAGGGAVSSGGGATNVWVPASQLIPKTTAGCGVNSSETTTHDQNYDTADFDTATDEFADFMIVIPNNWAYGTVTARFYWTADSGSGTVNWALRGIAYADDGALDQASGTAQAVTDTLLAAGDMHITSATPAITITGTPAANKPVQFTVFRDVSEDTLGVDARLLGVEIIFT